MTRMTNVGATLFMGDRMLGSASHVAPTFIIQVLDDSGGHEHDLKGVGSGRLGQLEKLYLKK